MVGIAAVAAMPTIRMEDSSLATAASDESGRVAQNEYFSPS